MLVAGTTGSSNFPTTPGAYDSTFNGYVDAFVSKLNNSLTILLASTYIGGSDGDNAFALVIDSSGNVFIAGGTGSSNFPSTAGVYDTSYNGNGDAFISKLNSTLTSLLASTYIGGKYSDFIYALAIDSSGNVFVVGKTDSSNFPTTTGAFDTSYNGGWGDAFISKLNSSLTTLLASTYIGGSDDDNAYALDIDSSGNVLIAGYTVSSDFPTIPGAYDSSYNVNYDAFISKLNSNLTTLLASTYIGGNNYDFLYALAIDSSGNIFIAGQTGSSDFPITPGIYDTSYNGGIDTFASKFDNYPCIFSISPTSKSFNMSGGTGYINVTTENYCSWIATSNASWITITSGGYGNSSGTTNYSVSTNTGSQRTGTITIAGEIFTVAQEGNTTFECSAWDDVINKYQSYVTGQAGWSDVILCYQLYAS